LNLITCERRTYANKSDTHIHAYAQLILPLHGKLFMETAHKKLLLEDETMFFLPPACSHTFNSDNNNEFLVLDIAGNLFSEKKFGKAGDGMELSFDNRWKAVRCLLLEETHLNKNSSSINSLYLYLHHILMDVYSPPSVKYINEHYAEDVDLKKLAGIEHYNVSYYSEWFKKTMKVPVMEYIQHLRMKKARELLLGTDFTILQIAQMVGYSHNSSFTRIFTSMENATPLQFRKNHK